MGSSRLTASYPHSILPYFAGMYYNECGYELHAFACFVFTKLYLLFAYNFVEKIVSESKGKVIENKIPARNEFHSGGSCCFQCKLISVHCLLSASLLLIISY